MNIGERLTVKTWYAFLFIIRFIIGIHVAYLYVSFSSDTKESKGGTFIEATTTPTNYLPYTSNNDSDKFYQSLLFVGCVYPTIQETSITYREELCNVSTDDYQRFTISVNPGKTRSDGTPITLNDVYFTYKTLIGDNYWNLSGLETYRNISVSAQPEDRTITVTFPSPSVDNEIFFTNFILPSHLLANQSYETYIEGFIEDPVNSTCIGLQNNIADTRNTVFDLTNCSSTLLNYYQVKSFADQEDLDRYIANNPDTIDMVFTEGQYPGYVENTVILNRFVSFFLNTNSTVMSPERRQNITRLFNDIFDSVNTETLSVVRDSFLFDAIPSTGDTSRLEDNTVPPTTGTQESNNAIVSLPRLPEQLIWGGNYPAQREFRIEETIEDKREIQFVFSDAYDAVSVQHSNTSEYFPASFSPVAQSSLYNLNPLFRNIVPGENRYTIRGYNNDEVIDTYELIVQYPFEEQQQQAPTASPVRFDLIYYNDPISNKVIAHLQEVLEQKEIDQYFRFESFDDPNTFEGKIVSQDYDIVLRGINMGLRKDISNLFTSSLAVINPSFYTNQELASAINRFFLANETERYTIKEQIDEIYQADAPIIIIGKQLGSIAIREVLDFSYPERLYVLGRRRDFIDEISIFEHVDIDRDTVFQLDNFFAFIDNHL